MGFLSYLYCHCPCCIVETRFVMVFFAFFGMLLGYCQRSTLTIGIVEMVDQKIKNATCPSDITKSRVIKNIQGGKVAWSEGEQGYVLAAFFIGYIIAHLPAGILCDKYGPRYPLLIGYIISTITTGLIPLGATMVDHWWPVFILRVLQGSGQGGLIPALSSLVSRWIPSNERTSVAGAIFSATSIGQAFGTLCSGLMISRLESWPVVFYFWAGIGVVYCLLISFYVFSDPRAHPYIHESELTYLKQMMQLKQDSNIPWKEIFADKCVYGIMLVQMSHDLIIFTLSNNFSKYLNQVLGFPVLENGLVSLIFLLLWFSSVLSGFLADVLIHKKNVNVTTLRKTYTAISNLGAFAFLMAAILVECDRVASIALFSAAIFIKGMFFSGGKVNVVDISLNHSGLMMSLINGFGAISGFTASFVIGVIAEHNYFSEWRTVVYIIGGVQAITIIAYIGLSNANRSAWDYSEGEARVPPPYSWRKQLSDEDHQARLVKDAQAREDRARIAKEAKQAMRRTT
ncbi:putative inorganic phosphate cotransporter [Atheta coriaria]|uniref:putative inorganic phosphate cotransporter n=1 Tax=Dalotia coriaria TaxID=877792 RepID=UPI0031F38518